MRTVFLAFALLLFVVHVHGQEQIKMQKVVPVLSEQSFYLNGGLRASVGGKSRVYYKIDLPPHTIRWYYSFTTSRNDRGTHNLELAAQLTKLVDPTGTVQIATELLLAPSGVASADIYMCDFKNVQLFMQKVDNSGGTFNYFMSGSRQNFTQGIVSINDAVEGTWFLGVKNPSTVDGINVNLEVAAIVEERSLKQKTDAQTKAELYGKMGWSAYLKGEYTKCIEHCIRALELDGTLPWVKCNLSLCQLIQNDSKHLESYIDAIACCKKSDHPKEYLKAALEDITTVLQKTPNLTSAKDIAELLRREIDAL